MFQPHAAFKRFMGQATDRDYITVSDIQAFLNCNLDSCDQNATPEECQLCVSQFDRDRDGVLCFQEFLAMILPTSSM